MLANQRRNKTRDAAGETEWRQPQRRSFKSLAAAAFEIRKLVNAEQEISMNFASSNPALGSSSKACRMPSASLV